MFSEYFNFLRVYKTMIYIDFLSKCFLKTYTFMPITNFAFVKTCFVGTLYAYSEFPNILKRLVLNLAVKNS